MSSTTDKKISHTIQLLACLVKYEVCITYCTKSHLFSLNSKSESFASPTLAPRPTPKALADGCPQSSFSARGKGEQPMHSNFTGSEIGCEPAV